MRERLRFIRFLARRYWQVRTVIAMDVLATVAIVGAIVCRSWQMALVAPVCWGVSILSLRAVRRVRAW